MEEKDVVQLNVDMEKDLKYRLKVRAAVDGVPMRDIIKASILAYLQKSDEIATSLELKADEGYE
jgi:plasmid stability protein